MFALNFCLRPSPSHFYSHLRHCHYPIKAFFFLSTLPQIRTHSCTSTPNQSPKNPIFYNYLIEAFNFPKPKALTVSNRLGYVRTLEKPQSVVNLLKSLGFSNPQIWSSVNVCPQILAADVHKTLSPKLMFFQELGFSGPLLGKFISKNSGVLTRSLDRNLKPCIELIKKILGNDGNNKDLIQVLFRCNWVSNRTSSLRLVSNVSYLKSCGISEIQLAVLFRRQPRFFTRAESTIRGIVERALEMGFVLNSGMLVHGIFTVQCLSRETLERKLELFRSFGFSKDEGLQMFRKVPSLARSSEAKLKLGMEFLLHSAKLKRLNIFHQPMCLLYNVQDRLIARYRVLEILKSKKLLKKEPRFLNVIHLPEEEFLEKYISRFNDNAEELLRAYKGHLLESSS